MPQNHTREQRIKALKTSFRAINAEDKPVTAATARNAKAIAAEPGCLSHKENTIQDFQRYLTQILAAGNSEWLSQSL